MPGSPGEYMWGGAGGTFFWAIPRKSLPWCSCRRGRSPAPVRPPPAGETACLTPRSLIEAVVALGLNGRLTGTSLPKEL